MKVPEGVIPVRPVPRAKGRLTIVHNELVPKNMKWAMWYLRRKARLPQSAKLKFLKVEPDLTELGPLEAYVVTLLDGRRFHVYWAEPKIRYSPELIREMCRRPKHIGQTPTVSQVAKPVKPPKFRKIPPSNPIEFSSTEVVDWTDDPIEVPEGNLPRRPTDLYGT